MKTSLLLALALLAGCTCPQEKAQIKAATPTDLLLQEFDEKCRILGTPKMDMTADQVMATCWGKPLYVNLSQIGRGVKEYWVYRSGVFRGAVYLMNGRVTDVSEY